MKPQRPISLVFIGGVHGVGKTTFSSLVAHEFGADHTSASALIKSARNRNDKRVTDVAGNQDELISGLNDYECTRCTLLLDGHFCLLSEDDTVVDVPEATFQSLNPRAIILLTAEPDVILARTKTRGGRTLPEALSGELQDRQRLRARRIASRLKAPLLELGDPFPSDRAVAFLNANLG